MTRGLNRRDTLMNAVAACAAAAFPSVVAAEAVAAGDGASTHRIEIMGFEFAPSILKVKPGDTVTWINRDIAPHTATARDGSWDTGRLDRGQSATIAVTNDFSPVYFCRFHPMMKASLEIVAG